MANQMRLVHGFGINDADYAVSPRINGRQSMCAAYSAWKGMIARAYSKKFHARYPTYSGVAVCEEWRSFMRFKAWWIDNHVDGWHLDKDLLTHSRTYSPESCLYVPSWLNLFTIDCGAARGVWPVGVSRDNRTKRFQARCRNPSTGMEEYLGYFGTKEEAHGKWLERKLQIAFEFKVEMDAIDERIYCRVIDIIKECK